VRGKETLVNQALQTWEARGLTSIKHPKRERQGDSHKSSTSNVWGKGTHVCMRVGLYSRIPVHTRAHACACTNTHGARTTETFSFISEKWFFWKWFKYTPLFSVLNAL